MITIRVLLDLSIVNRINQWIIDGNIEAIYNWPFYEITFLHEEDACAFILMFGGQRFKTRLECMLEKENEKSPN